MIIVHNIEIIFKYNIIRHKLIEDSKYKIYSTNLASCHSLSFLFSNSDYIKNCHYIIYVHIISYLINKTIIPEVLLTYKYFLLKW